MELVHIHPMIVHFPIVLIMAAFLFDAVRLMRGVPASASGSGRACLDTGTILAALAGLAAVIAFIFGDLAYDIAMDKGFTEAQLEGHEGWGTTTTIVLVAIAVVRLVMWWRGMNTSRTGSLLGTAMTAAGSVMVIVTAYFGGQLVYELGVNVM